MATRVKESIPKMANPNIPLSRLRLTILPLYSDLESSSYFISCSISPTLIIFANSVACILLILRLHSRHLPIRIINTLLSSYIPGYPSFCPLTLSSSLFPKPIKQRGWRGSVHVNRRVAFFSCLMKSRPGYDSYLAHHLSPLAHRRGRGSSRVRTFYVSSGHPAVVEWVSVRFKRSSRGRPSFFESLRDFDLPDPTRFPRGGTKKGLARIILNEAPSWLEGGGYLDSFL